MCDLCGSIAYLIKQNNLIEVLTLYKQVVITSTNPSELCINGMSFSRRASKWANAALVVTVSKDDSDALGFSGPLAGIEFQVTFSFCLLVIIITTIFWFEDSLRKV